MTTINYADLSGTIADKDFPIGINFQSKSEIDTFAQSIIVEVQNPTYAFNSYKCFRKNWNINLSVWEIKKLAEDKFPITIYFKDNAYITKFACSYYREKFQVQTQVNAVPASTISPKNDDGIDEDGGQISRIRSTKKIGILLGSLIAISVTVAFVSSTDWAYHRRMRENRRAEKEQVKAEKQHSYTEQSASNYTATPQKQPDSTPEYTVFNSDQDVYYYISSHTFATRDGMYRIRINNWFQWTLNGNPVRGEVQIVNIISSHTARFRLHLYNHGIKTTMIVNSETETISDGNDVYYIVKY